MSHPLCHPEVTNRSLVLEVVIGTDKATAFTHGEAFEFKLNSGLSNRWQDSWTEEQLLARLPRGYMESLTINHSTGHVQVMVRLPSVNGSSRTLLIQGTSNVPDSYDMQVFNTSRA